MRPATPPIPIPPRRKIINLQYVVPQKEEKEEELTLEGLQRQVEALTQRVHELEARLRK